MTDNEIIEALECCGRENCFGCPYRGKCHQGNPMIKDVLDLITRQQAEVERLNVLIKTKNKLIKGLYQSISYDYDRVIKEFAERLKHSFFDNGYESPDIDFDYFVDNLVKEMVGEGK